MTRLVSHAATATIDPLDEAILGQLLGASAVELRVAPQATLGQADERSVTHRFQLHDGRSVIFKRTRTTVDGSLEGPLLQALRATGLPVPAVIAETAAGGWHGLLMHDLGPDDPSRRPPTLAEAATLAAQVHAFSPNVPLRTIDSSDLAEVPHRALHDLDQLTDHGQPAAGQIQQRLLRLADLAHRRAACADAQPVGLCHGQLHPSRLLRATGGRVIVGWSGAYIGPVLLDLAALCADWPTSPGQTLRSSWTHLRASYGNAGHDRCGDLPSDRWAMGWHQLRRAAATLADAAANGHTLPLPATAVVIAQLQDALEDLS
ncbi:aminoglycoside phosphotransferase family protein [Dactylosporangium sp. NPDC048998]|uniref:aminoglycoside phosphotransferase family protein n=1 Tax=Dactylosporangium sp. NPDC048998 TaxID=3363976 RepID=UPI00371292E6